MLSQNACATMTQTLPVFLLVLSFERRSLMTEKVTASSERMRKVWKGITVVIFFVLMSAEVVVGLGAMRDDGMAQSWAQAYVTGCFIVAIAAVSAPVVMRFLEDDVDS